MSTSKYTKNVIQDENGNYTVNAVSPDELVKLAASIMRERILDRTYITNSIDTTDYLKLELGSLEHEVFSVVFLDNKHGIIALDNMFRGTIDGASVHPREVVKQALGHNAAAVILAHNHPSGDVTPSNSDKTITTQLKDALSLVDIRVLDHVIIGGSQSYSFAEKGLI